MPRIKPLPADDTPESVRAAYEKHKNDHHARITNMKATLGHSQVAFEVYMEWYRMYDQIKGIVGERMAYLFAYSISKGSNCPLCTTFFRKLIIDQGEKPEDLELSENEQLLLDFGSAIAEQKGKIPDALFEKISRLYTTTQLVDLIAFAGQMIATNIFSNTIDTDIDDYLFAYLPFQNKV